MASTDEKIITIRVDISAWDEPFAKSLKESAEGVFILQAINIKSYPHTVLSWGEQVPIGESVETNLEITNTRILPEAPEKGE